MPRRRQQTVILHLTDGRVATATRTRRRDRPPVVKIRYRGVGSGRPLREPRKTEVERERR